MKALKLIIIGMALFLASATQAQVSLNVHIGSPPEWGPVGYSGVRYYYLPDVEAYYDVQTSMFIYYQGNGWVHREYLPRRYRNYDLYGGYKVVMNDYHGNAPYTYYKEHRQKYGKGYHGGYQKTIGERHENGNHGGRMQNNRKPDKSGKNDGRGNDKGNPHDNRKGKH